MKKKIICLLLVLTFFFNSIPAYADDVVDVIDNDIVSQLHDDEVDALFLPAIAIPSAFGYLMAAFGVVSAGTVIYQNKDLFNEWYQSRVEAFKLKCTALNIAGTVVDGWLDKLSSGVVEKSSEVYSAFKTWVSSLDYGVSVSGALTTCPTGLLKAGNKYDFNAMAPSSSSASRYSEHYFLPNSDWYVYRLSYGASTDQIWICTVVDDNYMPFRRIQVYQDKTYDTTVDYWNTVVVDGKTYGYINYSEISGTARDCAFPRIATSSHSVAISRLLSGDYVVDRAGEYTIIGSHANVSEIDIRNPGKDNTADVVINWGKVEPVDVVGGVVSGTNSWNDVLTQGGVVSTVGDEVIAGDDTVVDVPGEEVPGVEVGDMNDYILDLTNIFPFCLPFDLIDFLNILSADPETPHFEYEMPLPAGKSYTFDIDLSPFDGVAGLMRTMETLAFIIGLIFITREKMIRG